MFCCLIFHFPPALKTLTTFSYFHRLSLQSPHCETWQPEPPPHHSSLLFSCLQDESFSFQTNLCESFLRWSRVWAAAFSSCVCCIFWFIYTHLIVAPRACQVETLHVHYASWVKFSFEIYMNAWIYLLLRRPCASWRVPFPVVALVWNGVAWSLKAPHMRPPNRAA